MKIPSFRPWGRVALVGVLAVCICAAERAALEERHAFRLAAGWSPVEPGGFLKDMAFGYDGAVADVMWLRALQYFGRQRLAGASMPKMGEYIDATVALDPHFVAAYVFGALALADEGGRPKEAVDLLLRGIAANPARWELPFELGFLLYLSLDKPRRAAMYFQHAARQEGCPAMAERFAAWAYVEGGDRESARVLSEELAATADDPAMKEFARRALERIRIEDDIAMLERGIARFQARTGRLPGALDELVCSGDLGTIPREPRGGFYAYRRETGEVDSSTRVEAAVNRHLSSIEDAVARYRARRGPPPPDLETLVREGFLREIPTVFGLRFVYDRKSGRVSAMDPYGV